MVDGKPNGHGVIVYHSERGDTVRYSGAIKDGKRHGLGSMIVRSKIGETILEITEANWNHELLVGMCQVILRGLKIQIKIDD